MDATIVIPVKNGGPRLEEVLKRLKAQKTELAYEIICVDSGSGDGSAQTAEKYGCTVHRIPPSEFGHGKTRNLGASLGTGKYIFMLTQDALPADENWLQNFYDAMEADEDIAGGFGKHLPYPDCNYPDRLMLTEHFARFGDRNTCFALTDENRKQYEEDEGYRQYLAFFSDNNSCLRRSVWEKIPYDDVDFAEDQFWARKILEKGYKKVYCPSAMVYHSHNYPLFTYGKRYYDDFKAVYRVYGSVLCPDIRTFFHVLLGNTRHECGYIRRRPELSAGQKVRWFLYSGLRNLMRNTASVRAVRYFAMPEEKRALMDRKYSQQYGQRRA